MQLATALACFLSQLQLYQPLEVYISLVGVEVWTTGSLITITPSDATATLGNFTQYRINNISPYHKNDNAQLLACVPLHF
jgi:Reprolysin (M12B) family zinc metalloprotease